jgi:Transposase DDE domain group 1
MMSHASPKTRPFSSKIGERGGLDLALAVVRDRCTDAGEKPRRFDCTRSGLVGKAEARDSSRRVVLDMDSTEIPVHGEREQSAYNGHFESTCYHPLLLFNCEGDCLICPGCVDIPKSTKVS